VPRSDRIARLSGELALLTAVGCTAGTLLGFLGGASWLLDLLAQFRVQYLYALVIAAGILAGLSRWRAAAVAWTAAAVNLWLILPLYLPPSAQPDPAAERVHLLTYNVNAGNPRHDAIVDYIAGEQPDVALLLEVTPELDRRLTELDGYRIASRARRDSFGIALLIRNDRYVTAGLVRMDGTDLPAVHGTVIAGRFGFQILGIHPPPPMSGRMSAERDRILELSADWAEATPFPRVVAGDFNATRWSHAFGWLQAAGLRDSARGFGVQPTWPRGLGPLGIPIDHVVHSGELAVVSRRTGPHLGSDHRPVHVVLAPTRQARTGRGLPP
jgi:endonuclease/exonuclease/phosphatase (EEP) superfamily protein YafD